MSAYSIDAIPFIFAGTTGSGLTYSVAAPKVALVAQLSCRASRSCCTWAPTASSACSRRSTRTTPRRSALALAAMYSPLQGAFMTVNNDYYLACVHRTVAIAAHAALQRRLCAGRPEPHPGLGHLQVGVLVALLCWRHSPRHGGGWAGMSGAGRAGPWSPRRHEPVLRRRAATCPAAAPCGDEHTAAGRVFARDHLHRGSHRRVGLALEAGPQRHAAHRDLPTSSMRSTTAAPPRMTRDDP